MDPLVISFVSALTALASSIIAPFVTLAVSERNFRANVLSANRQKWIEALRDTLAELNSEIISASFALKGRSGESLDVRALASDPSVLHRVERLSLTFTKVRLLLNPTKPDHQEIIRVIISVIQGLTDPKFTEADLQSDVERVMTLSQSVLREEWQRVKKGV